MTAFPQRLLDGYRAFAADRLPAEQARFRHLAEHGQSPEVMVIGCCDSRVSPEVIFDAGPGELFVVRNVANLVPPYAPDGSYHGVSAALEFAVQVLRVKHIVVLGHESCGGVRAAMEPGAPLSPGDFIGKWMSMVVPIAERLGPREAISFDAFLTRLAQASIIQTIENLKTFPCIKILADRGSLQLHGAYFGVASGALSVYDAAPDRFLPVEPQAVAGR